MKKVSFYIFFFVIIFQFSDCLIFDKGALNRLWFCAEENNAGYLDTSILTPVSFLSLYSNGTYTRDFGKFEYGRWTEENSLLTLINAANKKTEYKIKYTWPDTLRLRAKNETAANFEGQPTLPATAAEDPFSLQNNQWRINATHKETDKELSSRLINHCRFWEMYFTWALNKKIDYLDVRSTPSLLKIYGNGFVLRLFENLSDEWKAYFFDEEDCHKASDMMANVLSQKKIIIEHKEDKYKMFISMFQQLERLLS